jgi:MYXO-CTERM domain-containing protein
VSRRPLLALLSAALLAQPLLAIAPSLMSGAAASTAESSNPINDQGSNYHYRSNVTSITPSVHGLTLQVLEFADRLLLSNHTGRTVTIYGYSGEPYARVLANGTAEQNTRSPATYLNTSFYGNATVPPSASASAPPHWVVVDRTGQFEWHDHRIHYMSPAVPFQVKDQSKRTLVFDWKVPISVGPSKGAVDGQLFWTPESSKAPVSAFIIGGVIVLLGLLLVLVVRRRRRTQPPARPGRGAGEDPGGNAKTGGYREAW